MGKNVLIPKSLSLYLSTSKWKVVRMTKGDESLTNRIRSTEKWLTVDGQYEKESSDISNTEHLEYASNQKWKQTSTSTSSLRNNQRDVYVTFNVQRTSREI